MTAALLLALAVAGPAQQAGTQATDTTFAVRAGGTVEVEAHGGSVAIRVWDRSEMRVRETGPNRPQVRIRERGGVVTVEADARRGPPTNVRYEITVPRSYGVRIEGVNLSATVEGVQGDVAIDNVEGSIAVRGVTGDVAVESVSGGVLVENTTGRVRAGTVNQGIRLNRVRGDIEAETVNGSIVIEGAESSSVQASTVNGLVVYNGAVRDGGRYYLGTHNGRITMSLAEDTNARVTVSTNTGKVDTAFPVNIGSMRDRELSFTLGSGSARVSLESFNGTIHLVRPGGR